jgi:TonB family protein
MNLTPLSSMAARRIAPSWMLGAATALFLHGGVAALGALGLAAPDDDNDVGAAAMDVALEYEAPHREPSFLPAGADADASAAAAAAIAQEKKAQDSEAPETKPLETEEAEQKAAPEPNKKVEEKPKEAQQQTAASQAAQASEAAAAQSSLVAREAPQARAPAPGVGEQARVARLTWRKQLAAHLDRAKRYPADGGGHSATVLLKFRLDRAGHVLKAEAAPGQHEPAFETAALAMMKRADPAPAPPPSVADDELSFVLPVIFRAKAKM